MWLLHWKGRVLATGPPGKSILHNSPQPTGWRVCANSSLWNTHSRGFISLVSYPWCISLLLNHVHPRQLAREKAASPQSRVIHLRATGQHGALSWETSIRLLGSSHPPSFCFVSRSRITRTEGHSPHLVSHMQVLGGVWRNVKTCCAHSHLCPTLCDPMDYSLTGSSVHGVLQARILEWVAIFFSRWFSPPRDQTHISQVSWTGWWVLYH